MDTTVVSNWKKARIFDVHDSHVAGYSIRGDSRKLLSALDRGLFARLIRGDKYKHGMLFQLKLLVEMSNSSRSC